jgi:hypothetical protein
MKSKLLYCPIMKSKTGERWALRNLRDETRAKIRPAIEIHKPRNKPLDLHLNETCESLHECWGSNRLYIDGVWLQGDGGDPGTLNQIFVAARTNDLHAIPIVRPDFSNESLAAVHDIAAEDGRGCLLRTTPEEAMDGELLGTVVDALGIPLSRINLLVDYARGPMNLEMHVRSVAFLADWRHFIAGSGVFPQSIARFPQTSWETVDRGDWSPWCAGIESGLDRDPIFADYTTRAPGAPAGGG